MGPEHERQSYRARRARLETHFDETAAASWVELTSEARVGPVRARVRAGGDRMRALMGARLPPDLRGRHVLDAGCGTGELSVDLARRGGRLVGADLSASLIRVARERTPPELSGSIEFVVGDMLDPALGKFDHAVALDSLIHYAIDDAVAALSAMVPRIHDSVLFTLVPRAPFLPLARAMLSADARLSHWRPARTVQVKAGVYRSQAIELCHGPGTPGERR